MATITKTTQAAVLTAIGTAALPADGVSELNYQQTDYRGDFKKHQIWINQYRIDRERLLRDLHRNREVFRVIIVFSGRVVGKVQADASLGTLSSTYFASVLTKLNQDPNFGTLVKSSVVSSLMTDGGMLAGTANPKAVAVLDFLAEYYTEN